MRIPPPKRAIVVVSFGTSHANTQKVTIDVCEQKIREAFPEYEVRRAFTSERIIDILKQRDNTFIDSPPEALQRLQDEGISDVIVQPLHIIPGLEFHDIVAVLRSYTHIFDSLKLGLPLLSSPDDYLKAARAMTAQLPALQPNQAVVFMGHGTQHPAHAAYLAMDRVFEDIGFTNVFMGTLEQYPSLEHVIVKLQMRNITQVTLMPFMLVAGEHAQKDMAGNGDGSWKTRLGREGFHTEMYLHGLGENPAIQNIYVHHVEQSKPPCAFRKWHS